MTHLIKKVPHWLDKCSDGLKDMMLKYIDMIGNSRDLELFIEYLTSPHIYKFPRVSFDTFLDSSRYLGIGRFVYPEVRRIVSEILNGGYTEAVVVAGIGSGKTHASNLITCYKAHELLCLQNPHLYYHLIPDKPIGLINMGTTATQALEVAFAGIKKFIEISPWFQSFHPHTTQGKIRFPDTNILIMSGNSKSTTPLGHNIFNATLDEAAFFIDTDRKQVAEEIYTALQRRIISRFRNDGLLVMISSPLHEGDFVMRKLSEAKKLPDDIFSIQLPTWKVKPIVDEKNFFHFNSRKNEIMEEIPEMIEGGVNKLKDSFNALQHIWEIPGEFKRAFVQDPDKAKRDFAAMPSKAVMSFMSSLELIEEMFTEQPSPLQANGKYIFPEAPLRTNYYIHVDLALNKDGNGDYAGMSMCHFGGWEVNELTKEKCKTIVVDLAERIKAGPLGEIDFGEIRNKIYTLKAMKYNIKKVTLDGFQSRDFMQLLRKKGIRSEYLSVDRTIEPYQETKELIYSKRIKCHKCPELAEELYGLEITKASKVDHSPGSRKDIADAVAGASFSCLSDEGIEMGVMSGLSVGGDASELSKSEKEKYYEELQEMMEQGLLA